MCFKGYALNSLQCEFAFISSKCILVLQRYTQYHLNPPLTSELHLDGHCPKTDVIDTANQKLPENIIKNKLKKKNNISSLTFSGWLCLSHQFWGSVHPSVAHWLMED